MTTSTIILLICAVVITLGFVLLVAYLLPAFLRLKDLMSEVEHTASEFRRLAVALQETNKRVNQDLQLIDELLETSKETVATVSDAVRRVNGSLLKHSAGLLALLPAIRLGWKLVQRIKGGR